MRLKRTYSSREVAALTGLTARQLQVWDAGGLLSPSIPSHKTSAGGYTERRYTPIELFELLALADLRRRGFTVYQLHSILRVLEGVGLVRGARRGRERRFAFEPARLDEARVYLDRVSAEWDAALGRLRAWVENEEAGR